MMGRAALTGVVEAGWKSDSERRPELRLLIDGEELVPTMENITRFGHRCIAALQSHEDAPAFIEPVKAEEVPDYYDIIKVRCLDCVNTIKRGSGKNEPHQDFLPRPVLLNDKHSPDAIMMQDLPI